MPESRAGHLSDAPVRRSSLRISAELRPELCRYLLGYAENYSPSRGEGHEQLIAEWPPFRYGRDIEGIVSRHVTGTNYTAVDRNDLMLHPDFFCHLAGRSNFCLGRALPLVNRDGNLRTLPKGDGNGVHASGQEKCSHGSAQTVW